MDKVESAFELLTRAHSEWEEGCYEKAVSKLNQAKEKIISLSDNGGKLRKIVADIDEQLDAIETEQAARDQLLEALLNSRTPEVPPADPGTWSAPTPRPALQKKRATPDNKKSSSRVPIPKVPTDRDKRPTRAGNSTDEPAPDPATVRRNSIIDKYCTTGSYDRSLLDAVLSMLTEGAPVHWSDITGLEVPKETFRQTVILPRIMPEFFTGIRRPANAILMFGPPGSGKTLLAKAVATESNSTFFLVQTADLASKWRGDAEKIVKLLFNVARDMSPATIFFDEIDAIASQRGSDNEHEASRRLKSQLLVEMDGFSTSEGERILVLGATNFPWHIDEALRRRFEKRIYIDLPEKDARLEMLQRAFDCPLDDTVNLDSVATQLEGYSPADITILCRRASMVGITRYTKGMSMEEIQELTKRELVFPVTSEEIHETLNSVKPSVDPASLVRYQEWLNNYGSS